MKLYTKLLLASLMWATQLFGAPNDCFQKYAVHILNDSGGYADITKTNGIGLPTTSTIPHGRSLRVLITKPGAQLVTKAGPEDDKSVREIKFYNKDHRHFNPHVVLNKVGFTAEGFSQKFVEFDIMIENRSGGIAHILDSCGVTVKDRNVPDGNSARLTVKPSSYIILEYGPEKNKSKTKMIFADQLGNDPQVTLSERGWFTSGIQPKDVGIQTHRPSTFHPLPLLRRRVLQSSQDKKVATANKKENKKKQNHKPNNKQNKKTSCGKNGRYHRKRKRH